MGSVPERDTVDTDVLIVGGGPIGLSLAYQLRHFSTPPIAPAGTTPISVHIIEALPKPKQEAFGRAVTFWPRSVELLSQMGLASPILQQCNAVRHSAAYDREGKEVFDRGWSFVESISDTRYRFASVLRQKYVEDIFRSKLQGLGVDVMENHRFVDLKVNESVPAGEKGRIEARIAVKTGTDGVEESYTVRCRYLIGCDGTRTVVRGAAGIGSEGSRTEDKWVRVDGLLKSTNMPKPHAYGSLESPIYGNVLWIPIDHGCTRIGFSMKEERRKLYDKSIPDSEVFVKEAVLSVAPFELEYERVDWASVYSVGQRLAHSFWAHDSVFLAGDSAHSHSSGAGQGMNTGVQDSANLGWKLAMVLMGSLKREVLATYNQERLPNAAKLIRYDEDISTLITGRLPNGWTGPKDPNEALGVIFKEATGFNTGLTIGYDANLAVWRDDREAELSSDERDAQRRSRTTIPAPAIPGYRAPDVQLLLPALWEPCWLHELTPNVARFSVLMFLGTSESSQEMYRCLRTDFQSDDRLNPDWHSEFAGRAMDDRLEHQTKSKLWPVYFISVLPHKVRNAWVELGNNPIGSVYYDSEERGAARRYDVDLEAGGVFVLRPDGFIGATFPLSRDTATEVKRYLGGLLT